MSTLKVNNVTDLGDDAVITDGALVGAGKILQVVSVAKTDVFTTSSTSFTNVTGMSVTITPIATSSKILITVSTNTSSANNLVTNNMLRFVRGTTPIFVGDASGARTRASFAGNSLEGVGMQDQSRSVALTFLDAPATTSATTYALQARVPQANPMVINIAAISPDSDAMGVSASSITLMEVAG